MPIRGLEGSYEVSNLGRVRSIRILNPCPNTQGYLKVNLPNGLGSTTSCRVHKLVLETFVGPAPEGTEGCHCNGNRIDNRLENLRWDTRKANTLDKYKHGSILTGERHPLAKLTDRQADQIRKEYRNNPRELARKYGVSRETIRRAVNNERYKNIPVSHQEVA
jgi:hypothetical protein